MTIKLEVEGMEFVRRQLEVVAPRAAKSILRRSVARIAANAKKEMRKRAPRDENVLRRAIVSRRLRGSRTEVAAGVFVTHGAGARHDAWYWHMVEFGTEQHSPQEYATPVVEEIRQDLRREFGQEVTAQLKKELEKIAARQTIAK